MMQYIYLSPVIIAVFIGLSAGCKSNRVEVSKSASHQPSSDAEEVVAPRIDIEVEMPSADREVRANGAVLPPLPINEPNPAIVPPFLPPFMPFPPAFIPSFGAHRGSSDDDDDDDQECRVDADCTDSIPCNDNICRQGQCEYQPVQDGTSCDDGNLCTENNVCESGECVGTAVVCPPPAQCHLQGICNPLTGLCSTPNAPNGIECANGDQCISLQTCQDGVCTSASIPVCNGDNCFDVCRNPSNPVNCTDEDCSGRACCTQNCADGSRTFTWTCFLGLCSAADSCSPGATSP